MINLVTIGSSVITVAFARAVDEVEGIRVAVAYSRDAERARAFADEIGAAGSSADLDAVLADPEIHAVYVGSPNGVHAAQVRQALRAGKHVLVEKPAVATSAEWRDLVDEARRADRVLIEGMRLAYDPGTAAIRDLLPSLGVLRRASLHYQKRSSRYDDVLAGRQVNIFDPALGGGALADLGVYGVHAAVLLFGRPDAVRAASVPIASGADGAGILLLEYPGLVVDVAYSKITNSDRPSEIQGEEATLSIDEIVSARRLTRRGIDGSVSEQEVPGGRHSLRGEVARFVDLIRTGAPADEDQERTFLTLETMERARAALAG
ncbi:Gfo/Idh/MocA family oxidoreductase [Microbacterium sp. NPDC089189]|uniref:Gfo/Idh/MocA family protein n=1 Tax=Microbacterium sp. NPDC089189 TaxID=3154972 RepID=UPI0034496FAB